MKKIYGLILLVFVHSAFAKTFDRRPEVKQFIVTMVKKHNFEKKQLESLFNKYDTNQEVLQKIANPAEKLSWGQYKKLLISNERINKGKAFLIEYNDVLLKAERQFGVPKELITAILGVESFYGEVIGKFSVLQALATLAFDYPPREKFFRSELEHFLLLTKEEKLNPITTTGSYAGAMSPAQFISSSYRAYAVDFANAGTKDLNNMHNAIGSIANYFHKHGWDKQGKIAVKTEQNNSIVLPKQTALLEFVAEDDNKEYWLGFNNFNVITKYNNSNNYAMAVYQLAQALGLYTKHT